MSEITDRIKELEERINASFDNTALLIDPRDVLAICTLRQARLTELVKTHEGRLALMREKTAQWRKKIPPITTELEKLMAPLMDRIYAEQDKYDQASVRWALDESACPWEESEAAAIAAGILILFDEIR